MACCSKASVVPGDGGAFVHPNSWSEPQCRECVDKHLSRTMCRIEAALAIAQEKEIEKMDGYPSRFKIFGELDSAQKWSEQWPELQKAIIEARDKYKVTNQPIDWEPIEKESARMVFNGIDKSVYHIRFKIIGNLALAEEHSLKWPELHHAIRKARKAFQTKGIIPDWAALAKAGANTWLGEEVSGEEEKSMGQNPA